MTSFVGLALLNCSMFSLKTRNYSKHRLIRIRFDRRFYPVWVKIRI